MRICLKELRKSKVWLKIIIQAKLIKPASRLDTLIDETDQLISIFVKSIKTANKRRQK
jgi:four helix bundle protein